MNKRPVEGKAKEKDEVGLGRKGMERKPSSTPPGTPSAVGTRSSGQPALGPMSKGSDGHPPCHSPLGPTFPARHHLHQRGLPSQGNQVICIRVANCPEVRPVGIANLNKTSKQQCPHQRSAQFCLVNTPPPKKKSPISLLLMRRG